MQKDLKDLIEISRFYGVDKGAVIAGGGNTSMKTEDKLWVKASGHALATIEEEGFAVLDRQKLEIISSKTYSKDPFERERQIKEDLMAANLTPDRRPSVETSLHDLIRAKFVVHLHPALVNGLMCGQDVEKHIMKIFGEDFLYIPYIDPGYTLFKEIGKKLTGYRRDHEKDPAIILLQNHGIFVGADTTKEIRAIYDHIFLRLAAAADTLPGLEEDEIPPDATAVLPALRSMLSEDGPGTLRLRKNALVDHFSSSPGQFEKISIPFTPDIIVYCKSNYIYLEHVGSGAGDLEEMEKTIEAFVRSNGYLPKILLMKDLGMIGVGQHAAEADTILDVFEDMMQIAWMSESYGGPHPMTPEQIRFIDTWEVENYRRKAAAGKAGKERAEGKTIIVTGAAMGFGAGIARGLFEEGANMVIADINEDAGRKMRDELNNSGRKNQALFVRTDVADPESQENLMRETVKSFGGIDAYISNAGILRAGGLDEMNAETFDLVTRINYNAFFYGTKAASRIMRIQQEAISRRSNRGKGYSDARGQELPNPRPSFCDIIQINSKSGLSGSKKNFAYAGGKFGGIGLTQSFALELAPHNIKVNAVCPGNFFEGPLWSDPENGLFVQYLLAGKVPGAETVDDVRKHYEAQVPLGRGCRVLDVLKAVLYIMEQEYETGQAVPVTGGQTMLN
jgi:rhamnose utilization protein RhaD (predicted bifunctional aldolase and dehydrogenase)/NAD(P)-dependent dehydrogenase (short-subunit alcohol dehydrogenase family)